MTDFLDGDNYTHLCDACRRSIDRIADLYRSGVMEDTDDPEAPVVYVYDNRLGCRISNLFLEECPGNITQEEIHSIMEEHSDVACHCEKCQPNLDI